MYRNYVLPLTAAGTPAGSAVGTVTSYEPIAGEVKAIHFAYSGTATTTDVAVLRAATGGTLLAVANSVTDAWYYPSVALHDGTAGLRTWYQAPPVVEYVKLTVGGAVAGDTVTATLVVET